MHDLSTPLNVIVHILSVCWFISGPLYLLVQDAHYRDLPETWFAHFLAFICFVLCVCAWHLVHDLVHIWVLSTHTGVDELTFVTIALLSNAIYLLIYVAAVSQADDKRGRLSGYIG